MNIKLIAIGNRLMGDDGVAILIAENIRGDLEEKNIEVIIGETDFLYCLSEIKENEYIIILDATWFGIEPGSVTQKPLNDVFEFSCNQSLFSQHGYSLIRALKSYYTSVDGLVIGIECRNFDFSLTLSSSLQAEFQNICKKVIELCVDHDINRF